MQKAHRNKMGGFSELLVYGSCIRTSVSIDGGFFSELHLSGSACVMSMRGREPMGRLVGLVRLMGSSSGVSGLPRSLSFSACRQDSGGNCRLPEKRRCTLQTSTLRVLPVECCPMGDSVFS